MIEPLIQCIQDSSFVGQVCTNTQKQNYIYTYRVKKTLIKKDRILRQWIYLQQALVEAGKRKIERRGRVDKVLRRKIEKPAVGFVAF